MRTRPSSSGATAKAAQPTLQGTVPRLRGLSLRFSGEYLEQSYQEHERAQFMLTFRAALMLGVLINLAFAFNDVWIAPDSLHAIWLTRGITLALTVVLMAFPDVGAGRRAHHRLAALVILLYGTMCWAQLCIIPQAATNLYYVGMILIMAAADPLLSVGFANGIAISLVLCTATLALLFGREVSFGQITNHAVFLLSSLVITSLGSYQAERGRRMNFFARCVIEREREESRRQAFIDPLCNIPNRRLLMQKIEHAMLRCGEMHNYLALVFIDINNFKKINDAFGHGVGDKVLQDAAARLSGCIRTVDTVSRLGGDEFVVLLEDLPNSDTLDAFIARIADCFRLENSGELPLSYGASMGHSIYPGDAESAEALLEIADKRMYDDKSVGRQSGSSNFGPERSE
jgi:diguanylate cyclase (GGDEF)-like protein